MINVFNGGLLSGFFSFVGAVFLIGCFAVIAFPYNNIKLKLIAFFRNICFIVVALALAYGFYYEETDEIITRADTPIEYTIVKGKAEKHVSSDTVAMFTYYAFSVDTNNVFSFYYSIPDEEYGQEFRKESVVMDENFHIREINEDKCYIQIQDTQHYKVYKSKLLGTEETNIGKDTEVYLYVPAGTLSASGEIILD